MADDPRVWTILAYLFDPDVFGGEEDFLEELEDSSPAFSEINREVVYDALGIEFT